MRGRHADRKHRRWSGRSTGVLVTLAAVTLGAGVGVAGGTGSSSGPATGSVPPQAAAPGTAPDRQAPDGNATRTDPDRQSPDDGRVAGRDEPDQRTADNDQAEPGQNPPDGGDAGSGDRNPPEAPSDDDNRDDDAQSRAAGNLTPPDDTPPVQQENADVRGSCVASYRETSRFFGGFTGEVTIRAEGAAITSWQATVALGFAPRFVDVRDGNAVRADGDGGGDGGDVLTVTPQRDEVLQPGRTTAFNITVRDPAEPTTPTLTCEVP